MIRRIEKNNDLRDVIKSYPSGVIDDVHTLEYFIKGYDTKIRPAFHKEVNVLVCVLPAQELKKLPNGMLYRRAYYSVPDASYPDGKYDLEIVDCMNVWLGEMEETPASPVPPMPDDYLTPDDLKTINGQSIVGEGDIEIKGGSGTTPNMLKVRPYFYEMEVSNLDYEYAKTHIGDPIYGGCSVVNRGNMIGRNYDWKYDNKAEFLVKTPAMYGRYAVMGMCGGMNKLTEMFVDSLDYTDDYRLLPFNMLDGINSEGLYCSMNVVPATGGMATEGDICDTMLVRYILDHFNSTIEVMNAIPELHVYNHPQMAAAGYELHFYVADRNGGSMCIEWGESGLITFTTVNALTNFHIAGVNFNLDGTVNTPEMACYGMAAPRDNNIEGFESGLERWNYIVGSKYEGLETVMEGLFYTNAYKNQPGIWFSEFIGGDFDVNVGDFQVLNNHFIEAKAEYERRDRETGKTWQTVHSCIYDLDYLTVTVTVQEDTDYARTFSFNDRYTNDEIDEKFATKSEIPTKLSELVNDADYSKSLHIEFIQPNPYTEPDKLITVGGETFEEVFEAISNGVIVTAKFNNEYFVLGYSYQNHQISFIRMGTNGNRTIVWYPEGDITFYDYELVSKFDLETYDYASKSWVEGKGYLTQHQDISGKVDKSSIWTGTQAQWDALTDAQKASYTIALITE